MSPLIAIQDKKLKLTNLKKILYPKTSFTKAQVLDYYSRIAPYMLPHLKNRPITLKRFPNGVDKDFFYEKQCPSHKPAWIQTEGKTQMDINFCLINDLPSLIWVANLASIEIHTLLAAAPDLDHPTMVVFDLDPGPPATLLDCLEISLIMKKMFEGLSLKSFAKTSGGKGLHLYIPLNDSFTYDQTEYFAKAVAQTMEKFYPDRVVSKMAKHLRQGKVFIDWSQNVRHKTTVCVYSLRAFENPTVSMPLTWKQIAQALKDKNAEKLIFDPASALQMIKKEGDIFAGVLTLKQSLPSGLEKKTPVTSKTPQLKTYRAKRDFSKTTEPSGGKTKKDTHIFVIHKHAATRLHYDLRLEANGVLKSWAIPKGPSSDPAEKRLAVHVEDHPFDYKDFEGYIPQGQYGAGPVIIWDSGKYENVSLGTKNRKVSLASAIENGKIEVIFDGKKIKGTYLLVKLKRSQKDEWLFFKKKDKFINSLPEDLEQLGRSVLSGKTIDDIENSEK